MSRRSTTRETATGVTEILWEATGTLTVTVDRPAQSNPDAQGYGWSYQVGCVCGWTGEFRDRDSLGQIAFQHRCSALDTDWRPIRP